MNQVLDQPISSPPSPLLKILLGILIFLILGLIGFNFAFDRYGRFWEKQPALAPPILPTITPSEFPYDSQKAEMMLTKFLQNSLQENYLPPKIEVKQRLIGSGKQEGTDYTFGANWEINKDFFQSNFHYEPNTNNPSDMEFFIQPQGIKEATTSPNLTETLTKQYLKDTPSSPTFNCGVFENTTSFCENFSTSSLGKKGSGLVIGQQNGNNVTFLFSCFFPKDSSHYQQRTSCLLFR